VRQRAGHEQQQIPGTGVERAHQTGTLLLGEELHHGRVETAVVERLFKVQVMRDAPMELPTLVARADVQESRGAFSADALAAGGAAPPATRPSVTPRTATGEKVGRNDPCPCGSGKKYKRCCYLKGA